MRAPEAAVRRGFHQAPNLEAALVDASAALYQNPEEARDRIIALEDQIMTRAEPPLMANYLGLTALVFPDEAELRLLRAADLNPLRKGVYDYNRAIFLCGEGRSEDALVIADFIDAWAQGRPEQSLTRALVCVLRGVAHATMDRFEEAEPFLLKALELTRHLGMRRFAAGGLSLSLARKHIHDGDLDAARRLIESSIKTLRILADPKELAWGLATKAELHLAEGNVAAARAALDEADVTAPNVGVFDPQIAWIINRTRRAVEAAE